MQSGSAMIGTAAITALVLSVPTGRALSHFLARSVWSFAVRAFKGAWAFRRGVSTSYGSARFADASDLRRAGLICETGLIIGRSGARLVRHPSREASMMVLAPMGAGKGRGIVVPNLLEHPGSVICLDPKGENFAVTAADRVKRGKVFLLSMDPSVPSHTFNPMDTIGPSNAEKAAGILADLMLPHGVTQDSHWRERAAQWVKGLILHVGHRFADEPSRRHLGMVHAYLTRNHAELGKLIEAMAKSPIQCVRETAGDMAQRLSTPEGLSIISTAMRGTQVFSLGEASGQAAMRSDFALDDLFGDEPASLYLQVPLGEMAVYAGWLRVTVGLCLHAAMNVQRIPSTRPLFVLDEAATLGDMRVLRESVGQMRAYQQMLFVYQDMGQMKAAMPKGWSSIMTNCAINVAFGVNDVETAKVMSDRIGDTTVRTTHVGVSSGMDAVLAHHRNIGEGEHGRRLMMPNEITNLPGNKAVVTVNGLNLPGPLLLDVLKYDQEQRFAGRYGRFTGRGPCEAHEWVFPRVLTPTDEPKHSGGCDPANGAQRQRVLAYDAPGWERSGPIECVG